MPSEKQLKYWASMKGKSAWNKGKKVEAMLGNQNGFKKKQVPWNKGKKCSYVTERNLKNNPGGAGTENPNWKGGCNIYIKKQALIRDDYTCQICGLRDVEIVEVDHIKPRCIFPELEYEINNLMTLCPNCHARKTLREIKQGYNIELYNDYSKNINKGNNRQIQHCQ